MASTPVTALPKTYRCETRSGKFCILQIRTLPLPVVGRMANPARCKILFFPYGFLQWPPGALFPIIIPFPAEAKLNIISDILPTAGRIRDFHPLERARTGRTCKKQHRQISSAAFAFTIRSGAIGGRRPGRTDFPSDISLVSCDPPRSGRRSWKNPFATRNYPAGSNGSNL